MRRRRDASSIGGMERLIEVESLKGFDGVANRGVRRHLRTRMLWKIIRENT